MEIEKHNEIKRLVTALLNGEEIPEKIDNLTVADYMPNKLISIEIPTRLGVKESVDVLVTNFIITNALETGVYYIFTVKMDPRTEGYDALDEKSRTRVLVSEEKNTRLDLCLFKLYYLRDEELTWNGYLYHLKGSTFVKLD